MKKITRIVGVDCKIGRKSRTGSTVTMSVPDEFILDCTEYFREFERGNEILGKIKKISLNLEYEEDLMEDEQAVKLINNMSDSLEIEVVEDLPNRQEVDLELTNE